ncbi:MAG: SpoIIE family protein phosphatase, partial [Candidatus Eremiobacterota bacterium]
MAHRRTILAQVGGTLVLLYWCVGLPFVLLFLNYGPDQTPALWHAYAWQGPLLALGIALLPVQGGLRAVVADPLRTADRAELYRQVHRLPVGISTAVAGAMALSEALLSLGLGSVARLPLEECAKNLVLGLSLALVAATVTYFLTSQTLSPLMEVCATATSREGSPPVSLLVKASTCLLALGLVTTTVMGLVAYTSNQRLIAANLGEVAERRLELVSRQIASGEKWTGMLEFGGQEQVAILDSNGRASYYRGPEGGQGALVAQVARVAKGSNRGWTVLRHDSARILAWHPVAGEGRLLASLPLSEYSDPLSTALRGTLIVGLFTALLAAALSWFLARNFLRPLSVLTRVASRVPRSWPERMEAWYTDDEIGVLGRNFRSMLTELRNAQEELERSNVQLTTLVEERTGRMRQLNTLFTVARAVTSKLKLERVLEELMRHLQDLLQADGCSIMLADRDYLVPRSTVGVTGLPNVLRAGNGLLGEAAQASGPLVCQVPEDSDEPFLQSAAQAGFSSLVCAPMVFRDSMVGIVTVYYRGPEGAGTSDTELLAALTRQAAVSVVNAQLFDERDRVSQLLYRVLIPGPDFGFPGVEVGHRYIPSKMLSGDYYDLIPLGPRRFGLVMADVAGKGPEAAVVTVQVKHVVESHALTGSGPAEILAYLNRQLDGERMVTIFYAEADLEARTLRYVSAGHEPALYRPPEGTTRLLDGDGIVVGAVPDAQYGEISLRLEPGSLLVVYTDGVTEARSPSGEFLGVEPLVALTDRMA